MNGVKEEENVVCNNIKCKTKIVQSRIYSQRQKQLYDYRYFSISLMIAHPERKLTLIEFESLFIYLHVYQYSLNMA